MRSGGRLCAACSMAVSPTRRGCCMGRCWGVGKIFYVLFTIVDASLNVRLASVDPWAPCIGHLPAAPRQVDVHPRLYKLLLATNPASAVERIPTNNQRTIDTLNRFQQHSAIRYDRRQNEGRQNHSNRSSGGGSDHCGHCDTDAILGAETIRRRD